MKKMLKKRMKALPIKETEQNALLPVGGDDLAVLNEGEQETFSDEKSLVPVERGVVPVERGVVPVEDAKPENAVIPIERGVLTAKGGIIHVENVISNESVIPIPTPHESEETMSDTSPQNAAGKNDELGSDGEDGSDFTVDPDIRNVEKFAEAFASELEEYQGRLAGSDSETAAARLARDKLRGGMDIPARLEAFKVYPYLGRGMLPMMGAWLALCYALYYFSFAGKGAAGIVLTVVQLVAFLSGAGAFIYLWLGGKKFRHMLLKKTSYNVVGEFGKGDKTIIISSSHDQPLGSLVPSKFRKIIPYFACASALVLIAFSVLKAAFGTEGEAADVKIACFILLPAGLGLGGVLGLIFYCSPLAAHCSPVSGKGTAAALAAYAYLSERLPENIRLVYASFGGGCCCEQGAEAFCHEHPEFQSAKAICIGRTNGKAYRIASEDILRHRHFAADVADALVQSAKETGSNVDLSPNIDEAIDGYKSSALSANGVDCAELLMPDNADIRETFDIIVGAVVKLYDANFKQTKTEMSAKSKLQDMKDIKLIRKK